MESLLYAIGQAYNPSCTINGTTILKSRYFTLSAAIYKPTPVVIIIASNSNSGSNSILQSGIKCVRHIIIITRANEIRKSINETIIVLKGTINRGKYTLESKLELLINELLISLNAPEKNCQGSVAAETNRTLGTPLGTGVLKNQPINHITRMVNSGFIILQARPIAVCL